MIVIGADIHKNTHALAAVSGDGGLVAGELEIRADESGHRTALRWARELGEERVWAIEDIGETHERDRARFLYVESGAGGAGARSRSHHPTT